MLKVSAEAPSPLAPAPAVKQSPPKLWRNSYWFLVLGIVALALISYQSVLTNVLFGDDYAYLPWCKMAVQNPSMILTEFHRPWMNNYSNAFYRPMLTATMAADYAIWGSGGFGFHLSNFCYLLVASTLLGLTVFEVAVDRDSAADEKQNGLIWGFASAALFAVYPLHPEAITWMTGRVDCFTSMFILASLWCYIRWRKTERKAFAFTAAASMAVALMSKETGITVPIFMALYEFWLGLGRSNKYSFPNDILRTLKKTAPFWGLLVLYFVWRRIALGTFVGGYDNSLFFIADWKAYLSRWTEGLRNIVVPISQAMLGSKSWQTRLWQVGLGCAVTLTAGALIQSKRLRRPSLFLLTWGATSFIPVYKIFVLNNVLQGGRLVYLVTLSLCALLTLGFSYFAGPLGPRRLRIPVAALAVALLFLSTDLLYTNNLAWAEAGRVTNKIKQELNRFYHNVPGDPLVFAAGMPNQVLGAHCCVNAEDGLTKTPQIDRDIFHLIKVDEADLFTPLGFLKNSISQSNGKVKAIFWDSEKEQFFPSNIAQPPSKTTTPNLATTTGALKDNAHPVANDNVKSEWLTGQGLHLIANTTQHKRPTVDIKLPNISCWQTDFIAVKIHLANPDSTDLTSGLELLYKNDAVHNYDLAFRVHAPLLNQANQTILFPLRSRATWTLGGTCQAIELKLPPRADLVLESVSPIDGKALIPRIDFADSSALKNRGVLHFDKNHTSNQINFDATNIAGARKTLLEITRLSQSFEEQNTTTPSHVVLTTLNSDANKGSFEVARILFPSRGNYQARLRALNENGEEVGVAGDFVLISIDE